MGEFCNTHDLGEFGGETHPVKLEVELESQTTCFPIESNLSAKLHPLAKQHGVSPETLLNLWLQERIVQETATR